MLDTLNPHQFYKIRVHVNGKPFGWLRQTANEKAPSIVMNDVRATKVSRIDIGVLVTTFEMPHAIGAKRAANQISFVPVAV